MLKQDNLPQDSIDKRYEHYKQVISGVIITEGSITKTPINGEFKYIGRYLRFPDKERFIPLYSKEKVIEIVRPFFSKEFDSNFDSSKFDENISITSIYWGPPRGLIHVITCFKQVLMIEDKTMSLFSGVNRRGTDTPLWFPFNEVIGKNLLEVDFEELRGRKQILDEERVERKRQHNEMLRAYEEKAEVDK